MKTLFTLMLLLTVSALNAQIQISEKKVDVDGSENGYHITIPYGDKKIISKYLKDELKSWKGKVVTKDFFFADDCRFKDMGKNTFDAYARIEDITKGGVNVYVKVNLGGAYLNSKDHPGDFKFIEKKLYNFAVNAAKDIIEEEAKVEEKIMKGQGSDLEDIGKSIEKSKDAIIEAKKVIEASEEAIKKGEEDKLKKEAEIKATTTKIEEIRKRKAAVK